MNCGPGTAGHPFLLIHTAGRNKIKKRRLGRHHSPLQTQDSTDRQLFNYLCIRIPIDRLKKALSPWQQTSHSLYHRLSVRLPAESHPRGTGRGGRGKQRGGRRCHILISLFLRTVSSPHIMLHLPSSISFPTLSFCNFDTLVLLFSHTASSLLSILTSSHLSR